jgi:6-pyruvoyltetrahydropterin/6-carboxytetrahydropterin synthase
MSYEITVESNFSAAHRLRGYKGKCENIHGHNWRVQAAFTRAIELDKTGLVLDFVKAKKLLEKVLYQLDHKDINRVAVFKKANPSSELIAKFIYDRLKKALKAKAILTKVSVWETPTSCASYSE